MSPQRRTIGIAAVALAITAGAAQVIGSAQNADAGTAAVTFGRTSLGGADPSVIKVDGRYVSAKSADGGIVVRTASTLDGIATAPKKKVWSDTGLGEVWAPEIVHDQGKYRIYFSAGRSSAHRMYHISSTAADSGYSAAVKVALPADQWAIDGAPFTYQGQRWFVWSGWSGAAGANEQNLYIAKMSSATTTTGGRYIISQPREPWERTVGNPYINEAPQPVLDPDGRLHVVYSANGSWSSKYCLADLRLRAGGNPTNVWDWYKSNGCLFGSYAPGMMAGWTPTVNVDGPGQNTFVLDHGDIATSPPSGNRFPIMYHAVAKGTPYSWSARYWYTGTAVWWGKTTYRRANVPGATTDAGYSLKFFE